MKRLSLAMLVVLMLAGCNGWLQKPVDPAVTQAVDSTKATKEKLDNAIEKNKAALNDLLAKAELTKRERDEAVKMKAVIAEGEKQLSKVDDFLADAQKTIDQSSTNGDLILNSVGALAAAFGIPFVGLGVQVLRKTKLANAYATGISNLEKHRQADGAVNWDKLKVDNADAGINTILKQARGKA